jgi:molybdenum cofactor cytidylyltransferase
MRNVAAVILAAGGSSRFGRPKQLVGFRGETFLDRVVRMATDAGCVPVVVVVGASGDAMRHELRETSAVFAENQEWELGLGTSIRRGVEYLAGLAAVPEAVVLLTCDQVLVEARTITALIGEHEKSGKPIVASRYANTLGVPALFHRSCFGELLALSGDSGAKSVIAQRPDDVSTIAFEGGALDIDAPADLHGLA